jgi:hypothetical protein
VNDITLGVPRLFLVLEKGIPSSRSSWRARDLKRRPLGGCEGKKKNNQLPFPGCRRMKRIPGNAPPGAVLGSYRHAPTSRRPCQPI